MENFVIFKFSEIDEKGCSESDVPSTDDEEESLKNENIKKAAN